MRRKIHVLKLCNLYTRGTTLSAAIRAAGCVLDSQVISAGASCLLGGGSSGLGARSSAQLNHLRLDCPRCLLGFAWVSCCEPWWGGRLGIEGLEDTRGLAAQREGVRVLGVDSAVNNNAVSSESRGPMGDGPGKGRATDLIDLAERTGDSEGAGEDSEEVNADGGDVTLATIS